MLVERVTARRNAGGAATPAPRAARVLDAAVAAWVVVSILATIFGISPRLSWSGEIGQREGLLTVLALAGLYAGARRVHGDLRHARGTLTVMLACAALAAVYAMLQRAGLDPLGWQSPSTYSAGGVTTLRVFATSGNAILLGAVLAAALGLGLALPSAGSPRSSWRIASLALIAAALAATLSRGAILAGAVGAIVAVAAMLRTWGPRAGSRRLVAVGGALALAALWALIALRGPIAERVVETLDPRAESVPARIEMAKAVGVLLARRPVLGVGPDAFGLAFPAVQSAGYWRNSWLGNPAHAHSAALQVLATGGVLAGVAGLVWLSALFALLWPRRAASGEEEEREGVRAATLAAVAALVAGGAINPVGLGGAAAFVVLSAVAASLAGAAHAAAPHAAAAPAREPRPLLALAAAVLVLVAVATTLPRELGALAAAHRAQVTLNRAADVPADAPRLVRGAGLWATLATDREPAEDDFWRLRADAALAQIYADPNTPARDSLAADAAAAARRAITLQPRRAMNYDRLANAEAASGNWLAADRAFENAQRAAPVDPMILLDRHRTELERRRPDLALATAQKLVALYPEDATGHAVEAAAWLTMDRRAEAREALRRALAARWEPEAEPRRVRAGELLRALEADSVATASAAAPAGAR